MSARRHRVSIITIRGIAQTRPNSALSFKPHQPPGSTLCLASQFDPSGDTHERLEHHFLPLFQLQPELRLRVPREHADPGGCGAIAGLGMQVQRSLPLQSVPLHQLQVLRSMEVRLRPAAAPLAGR